MKKLTLLLAAAIVMVAGCAKEKFATSTGGEMLNCTFQVSMGADQTRAIADNDGNAAAVNRCIMEIYYDDVLFSRKYSVVDGQKKAHFNETLVSNRTYTVAFWADHVEQTTEAGLQIDNYYDTRSAAGLKAVALKGSYVGNIDARDAFAFCGNFEVKQGGSVFDATLTRPFAQINVITTDVATVAKVASLKPDKVNVTLKGATTVYNVLDSTAVVGSTANLTYTANVYNWNGEEDACTLSMDYIFAEKEKGVMDIDWKAKKTGNDDVSHAFASVPYQRNYRTNIKGALLTSQGQWTVTVDPVWGNPDIEIEYVTALNIADGNAKLAGGAHYVNILEPNDAETVNVKIPNTTDSNNNYGIAISGIPAGDSKTVNVEELGNKTGTLGLVGPQTSNFNINCPNLTVTLNGEQQHTYSNVQASTANTTLYIEKAVTITGTLTLTKGNAYIYGNVADVVLDPVQDETTSVAEWHVYDASQFAKAIALNTPHIVLESDIALSDAGVFTTGTTLLDLNGHILSRETKSGAVAERGVIIVNGGILNVYDYAAAGGKIAGTSNGANNHAVTVNGGTFNLYSGTLESDYAGVYVLGNGSSNARFNLRGGEVNGIYGVSVQYSKAIFYMYGGTINANIGVTGNGNEGRGGTYMDLYAGIINGGNEPGDAGIYHPQSGNLYIQDNLIVKGSTAIEMKSGTETNYSGNPSIEATTAVVSHDPNGNGVSTTGYAVALINNPGYSGNAKANIKCGMHYGPVAILDDDDNPDNNTAKMSITGGIFSIRPDDAYLAAGYAVIDNTDSQTKERYPYAIGQYKFVGSGTAADPYQVTSAADIKNLSSYTSKTTHFLLTQDLNLSPEELTVSGQYGGKAITSKLYGILDGGGHKITFPNDDGFYMICDRTHGATIKNLDVEFKEDGVVAFQNYDGETFENVNVSGKLLHFTGNCGAYNIYSFDRATFENCTCSADITGLGGSTDYNAVFVGYDISGGCDYIFRNCEYSGNMICGKAAMFIGNPNSGTMKLTVENCLNNGSITSTYVDNSYVMNYYYAVTSNNYTAFIINGVSYPGVANDQTWVPKCWEDPLITGTGTAVNGPIESGMVLTKNADNQFVVTPATGGVISGTTVAKYTVTSGLYVGVIGGSSRFYATEDIIPDGADSYTTMMKDYKFVDRTFVGTGEIVKVGNNDTFTDADGTYYVIGVNQTVAAKAPAEMYSLNAYDSNGKLLASVSLTAE